MTSTVKMLEPIRQTDKQQYLKRLIRRLVRAEIAYSCIGSAFKEDIEIIKAELLAARISLSIYITKNMPK